MKSPYPFQRWNSDNGDKMDYRQFDNQKLKRLTSQLRYDMEHLMSSEKREQAKQELKRVEAELRNRSGLRGIIHQLRRIFTR